MSETSSSFTPFSKADLEKAKARRPVAMPVPPTPSAGSGQRPQQFNPNPNQAPMQIEGQDKDAPFGRTPQGRPMTVAEFAAMRTGRAAPVPTVGGAPVPQAPTPGLHVHAGAAQHHGAANSVQYPDQYPRSHQHQGTSAPIPPQFQRTTAAELVPPSHPHIHYQAPAPVAPTFVSEAEGVAVDLPSRFHWYGFKDLFVHPLRGVHLAKLARAHAERSQLIMLEVVSSVLTTSDPQYQGVPLANQLLLGDYYWVLYYLRRNNYTKATFRHTTKCLDHKHLEAVERGEKSSDSLRIEELISESTLKNTMLDQIPVVDEVAMNGIHVRPATMQDMVETMEHPLFGKDHEYDYLSQLACYLYGPTLEDRIRLAAKLTPDQIVLIQEYEKVLSSFGIEETINVRCKECGSQRRTRVRIDASTFLPA